MRHAKLQLSKREKEMISDNSVILTKNRIITRTISLLQHLQEEYRQVFEKYPPAKYPEINPGSYKISRGENYRGLPWIVLDYPRSFDKEDIFAIRTMFWWGNFFSITLQLSGKWKTIQETKLLNGLNELRKKNFYLCIAADQWQHHHDKDNYTKLSLLTDKSVRENLSQRNFIKLSRKYPVSRWESVSEKLVLDFETIIRVCDL